MSPLRILVVTHAFRPSPLTGAVRWSLMVKYLERLGHTVTVVTSDSYGAHPDDDDRVIRPASLESSRALRRVLGRPTMPGSQSASAIHQAKASLIARVPVPDPWVISWVPFALRAARRVVRDRGIDCVITTSPGESSHLAGLALRRLGPAWVADFRDGWTFETDRPLFPTRAQRRLDRWLEARVVRRADVSVSVTEEIAADLRTRFGADGLWIPNGWDPESAAGAVAGSPIAVRADASKVRLVYTGRLGAGTARRSPEGLFRALERLAESDPSLSAKLELVVAGPRTTTDAELLAPGERRGTVVHVGQLSRSEALGLQHTADVLVLVGSGGSEAPGKLFEYLGAERPILHLGGAGAAARILAETGGGVTVGHEDVEAIVEQLRLVATGSFGLERAPGVPERYSYPHVAEQMASAIEEAIRRRAAHG